MDMKVSISRRINYFDIDTSYRITLGSLFRILQEASSKHSDDAEKGMTATNQRWLLNRIAAKIDRYPNYGETVTAVTWHRGSRGYKAYRDYELYADGHRVAAATTVWLWYDLAARRLLHVPPDTGDKYGMNEESATDIDIDSWKPDFKFPPDHITRITTRHTDYDPLNHVNNSIYFDYLVALLSRNGMEPDRIGSITLQFQKEIGRHVEAVETGCSLSGRRGVFKIFSEDVVFAAGSFEYEEPSIKDVR